MLSLFKKVYVFLHDQDDSAEFELPPYVLDELLAACYLAFTAVTDLRCGYVPYLFGTDASLHTGAIVRAPVSPTVSAELWRRSEHGGWHTRLCNRHRSLLEGWGVPCHPDSDALLVEMGGKATRTGRAALGAGIV